jgi:GNAT superfamily N-acetyltransferase
VRIRHAQGRDVAELTELMRAAKRSWGYPDEWMRAWEDMLTITANDLSRMRLCVAEGADGILGFSGFVGAGARVQLEHLWIRPDQMGKGIGRSLLKHALTEAKRGGADIIVIESDPNAEAFYHRMGAVRVGEVGAAMPGAPDRVLPLLEIRIGRSDSAVPPEAAG